MQYIEDALNIVEPKDFSTALIREEHASPTFYIKFEKLIYEFLDLLMFGTTLREDKDQIVKETVQNLENYKLVDKTDDF